MLLKSEIPHSGVHVSVKIMRAVLKILYEKDILTTFFFYHDRILEGTVLYYQ